MSIADKAATVSANNVIIAENEQKVYDKGVTDGRQAESDEFWNEFLTPSYGGNYQYYFAGQGWDNTTFKPTKNIFVYASAISMFRESRIVGDYDAILKELGIKITFGNANVNNCFAFTQFTKILNLDWSQITDIGTAFYGNSLLTDISMALPENKTLNWNNTFYNCSVLENIIITSGKIKGSVSFSYCTLLTHDSLMNIIDALYDTVTAGSTTTYTLTLGSTNLAKLTDEEKAIATEKGWTLA